MRPRLLHRGKLAADFTSAMHPRFNEAPAASPGKGQYESSVTHDHATSFNEAPAASPGKAQCAGVIANGDAASFNEAPAASPGKAAGDRSSPCWRVTLCFNEAPAASPGKGRRRNGESRRIGPRHRRLASMRPRLLHRGKGACVSARNFMAVSDTFRAVPSPGPRGSGSTHARARSLSTNLASSQCQIALRAPPGAELSQERSRFLGDHLTRLPGRARR